MGEKALGPSHLQWVRAMRLGSGEKGTRAFPLTVGGGGGMRLGSGEKGLGPSHLQWGRAMRLGSGARAFPVTVGEGHEIRGRGG